MKLTKGKIIAAAAVLCVLAAAFFLPGRGAKDTADAPQVSEPAVEGVTPAPDAPGESVAPAGELPGELAEEQPSESPAPEDMPAEEPPEAQQPEPSETGTEPAAPPQSTPAEPAEEPPAEEPAPGPLTCTLSISCAAILDNLDRLTPGKEGLVPADGWLLPAVTVEFETGESVFDVLKRELQRRNLHFEYSSSALYETAYIEGICNLYEYDCGELSGWEYRVNGIFPGCGCSQYTLSDGDVIAWVYTCDLGADVGDGR